MNLTPLYEVKDRLEHAAIAGTGLIPEDFRLRRTVDALAPLASASPVFAKIKAGADGLLNAPAEERGGQLLDVLSLVDAVAYTQGAAGVQGALSPLPQGSGSYVHASYCQLQPLITALTGTGSGRMAVVEDAWKNHPEYFSDFRVLPSVIAALGCTYSELADLAEKILCQSGQSVVSLLKENFAPDGKKEMVRRARLMAKLAGAQENEWYRAVLPDNQKAVRETMIAALSLSQDNTLLLLDLCQSERGGAKKMAMRSLACMDSPEARDFWEAEFQKHPQSAWELVGANSALSADIAARAMRKQIEELPAEGGILESEMYASFCACLHAMCGKISDEMRDLWRWLSSRMDWLHQYQPQETEKSILNPFAESLEKSAANTLAESVQKCFALSLAWNPCPELRTLARELADSNPDWFLCGAMLVDLMERPADEVYDRYAPYLTKHRTAADRRACEQVLEVWSMVKYRDGNGMIFHPYIPLEDLIHPSPEGSYLLHFDKTFLWEENAVKETVPIVGFDPRWAALIVASEDLQNIRVCTFGDNEPRRWDHRHEPWTDVLASNLLDPHSPELCAVFGDYFYQRMRESGHLYQYHKQLLRCGWTKWEGLLVHCFQNNNDGAWWSLIRAILLILPMSSRAKAEELRQMDELTQNKQVNRYNLWRHEEAQALIAQWEAEDN